MLFAAVLLRRFLTLLAATLVDYQRGPPGNHSCRQASCTCGAYRAYVSGSLHDRMGKSKLHAPAQSARAVLEAGQFEVLQCHGEHSVIAQVNGLEKRLFSKSFALTGECQVAAQVIHDPCPQVLHDDVLCTSTCTGRLRLQHGPKISSRVRCASCCTSYLQEPFIRSLRGATLCCFMHTCGGDPRKPYLATLCEYEQTQS
jgi:hypothetical protein